MRTLRWLRRHLGLAAECLGYLFWLGIDVVAGASTGSWLSLGAGILVPLLVLLRRRPGTQLTPIAVVTLSASVAISVVSWGLSGTFGIGRTFFSDLSFAEQLALAILVIAVLRRAPLTQALLLTAAAAFAIVGSPVLRSDTNLLATFAVLSALGWGGAVGIGLVQRDAETRRRAALDDVRSSERMELARELHDVVAHHVTGIIVAAQAAAVVARSSPDDVDRALAAIETAGTDAMAAMRRMVGVLRGQDDEGARTPGAELAGLGALVSGFDPDARLVRLHTDPGLEHAVLPAGVAATGYRVVQEALTNVRRHAPGAAAVEVEVRIREEALLVSVRNDGVSAPVPGPRGGPGGYGLVGMAERVGALDGSLTAGPAGPGVWAVAARLPLERRR